MGQFLYGSIEISKVPKELFKKVLKADGTTSIFLNIGVSERKEIGKFGETHGVQFLYDKEHVKVEGENTFCGSLKTYEPVAIAVTTEQINEAPPATGDDLPF